VSPPFSNTAMWARTSINRAVCCETANVTTQTCVLACNCTFNTGAWVDSCIELTLACRCGGQFIAVATLVTSHTAFQNINMRIEDDGAVAGAWNNTSTYNFDCWRLHSLVSYMGCLDGSVLTVALFGNANTATLYAGSRMDIIEIGGT